MPAAIDLSDLPGSRGIPWPGRDRRLTFARDDAGRVREELARRGVRLSDQEVRAAVQSALADDPIEGPAGVAAFGDARAVPELSRALDAFEHLDCVVCDYLAVLGLGTAILVLGGELTDAQRRKIAEYEERQRGAWSDVEAFMRAAGAAVAPLAVPSSTPRRLGRNQPCHCGSGKKYKLCHLDLDRAAPGNARH